MKYSRLLTRLYNQPLAIAQSKLDVLTSEVTLKLLAGESLPSIQTASKQDSEPSTAIIKVFDSLVSKNGGGDSGSTSYEYVTSQINNAINEGNTKLTFYIDSPGGEVSGLFGLAAFIASLPSKYGVETVAVTDGMATSAAYVIAASCQTILATSSSIIGSIGVIMTLINVAEADKKAGVSYTILRSKEDKALINPHEPFATRAIEDSVKMLGVLDTIMNNAVTSYRPKLSLDTITKLAGNTVLAEEALSLGLIDGIVTSFSEVMTTEVPQQLLTTTNKGINMTLEEALAKNIELSSELQSLKASTTLEVAKAKQTEQDRVLGILDAAATFKLSADLATKRIKAGASIADTVEMFEGIKEALQMSGAVDTSLALQASLTKEVLSEDTAPEDFLSSLMGAVDKLSAQETYNGVR
jgi:ClpP class serine protease